MSIAVTGSLTTATTADYPLYLPRLCVHTWVPKGTISADSEVSGHPAVAVRSPLTYSYWRPSAMPAVLTVDFGQARNVDYAALYTRLQADSEAVEFTLETYDGSSWTEPASSTSVAHDGSVVWLFDKRTVERVRITATGADAPLVATFQSGLANPLPVGFQSGFAPGQLNPQDEYTNTMSEGGQVLGRSVIRSGMEQDISIDNVEPEWVRSHWPQLRRLIRSRGVWLVWDAEGHPSEVVYGMASDASTSYSSTLYMRVRMTLQGPQA